jgi:hypothetical protein
MSKENFIEKTNNKEKKFDPNWFEKGYRVLATWYHPDNKETGDEEKMKIINTAHDNEDKKFILNELKELSLILNKKEQLEKSVFSKSIEEINDLEMDEFIRERFSGIIKKDTKEKEESFDRPSNIPILEEEKEIDHENSFERPSILPELEEDIDPEESFDRPSITRDDN